MVFSLFYPIFKRFSKIELTENDGDNKLGRKLENLN